MISPYLKASIMISVSPSKSVILSLPKPIPAPLPKPVPAPLQMTSLGKAPMAIVRPGAHTKLSEDPALIVNTAIPPPDISRPPPAPVPAPNLSKPPPKLPVISSTSQANVLTPNVIDKERRNLIFCQKDASIQSFFDTSKAHFIGIFFFKFIFKEIVSCSVLLPKNIKF